MREFEKGFTLAEVLVTLAIVGVVAALTIPTLMHGIIDQRYTTAIKKHISTLNAAIYTSISNDDGDPSSTTITTNDSLAKFFKPHMNVLKDNNTGVLWLSDGSKLGFVTVGPNTTPCVSIPNPMNMGPLANSCYVIVDLNGDKGPNKIATSTNPNDIYLLGISPKTVIPVGQPNILTITTIPAGFTNDVSGNPITTNPYSDAIPGNASISAINGTH